MGGQSSNPDDPSRQAPSNLIVVTPPSQSTLALLSLTQDITALVSLSLEATASLVHDWFRSSLLSIGIGRGQVVRYVPPAPKSTKRASGRGESARGLAVVVLGAAETTGQSLTLHLAKSGYTVFPLLALPSPVSPPTSHALSSLLLTWSSARKRLRSRYPNHPGLIVPIMIDPESRSTTWTREMKGKGRARFGHAGETVRAYMAENDLKLVAVVCASREGIRGDILYDHEGSDSSEDGGEGMDGDPRPASPDTEMIEDYDGEGVDVSQVAMTSGGLGISLYQPIDTDTSTITERSLPSPTTHLFPASSGLLATDETALLSLYRSNVLEPLSVIREFQELLAVPSHPDGRRGRVVFVNTPSVASGRDDQQVAGREAAMKVIQAARAETARVLRDEMGDLGIEVCEVAVGPMAPRLVPGGRHLRHVSEDSAGSGNDAGRRRLMKSVLQAQTQGDNERSANAAQPSAGPFDRSQILASRLALLTQLWAVDDALLYSSVRRAIEDRYPRAKHHAGLSPFVESVAGAVPGMGVVKALGRWVLGRLLVPRSG